MRAAVAIPLLAGCYAGGYSTFTAPFVGTRANVGCLDVAVALTEDDAVAGSPVISYQFGNHCFHQTMVDFTSLRVVGTLHTGATLALQPYDPIGELRPLQLDAWSAGDERIAYASTSALDNVCVDLGRFDGTPDAPPQWKCMAVPQ